MKKTKCISNYMKYIHWQETIKLTALGGKIIQQWKQWWGVDGFKISSPQIGQTLVLSFNYNLIIHWNETKDRRVLNLFFLKTVPNSQPPAEIINDLQKKVLFSICKCLNIDKMATAQRKSHRHRSELKHLFISRAPPLNQTEPDPGHWPPDRDFNVVQVRTAGPSHTLLGVLLTTPFIQPYRLGLTDCNFSHNSTENVLICTAQMTLHVVQLPTLRNETERVLHKLFFQRCRKLMEA